MRNIKDIAESGENSKVAEVQSARFRPRVRRASFEAKRKRQAEIRAEISTPPAQTQSRFRLKKNPRPAETAEKCEVSEKTEATAECKEKEASPCVSPEKEEKAAEETVTEEAASAQTQSRFRLRVTRDGEVVKKEAEAEEQQEQPEKSGVLPKLDLKALFKSRKDTNEVRTDLREAEEEQPTGIGKVLSVAKSVFAWVLLIAAVCMMIFTVFSVSTLGNGGGSVFGYRFLIVQTNSMQATDFDAGDIVFIKDVEPSTLKEGDIIAYTSQNTYNFGDTVTHKIRRLTTTSKGEPGFVTYGTTTDTDDEIIVTYPYVLGKYTGRVPKVGKFFVFLKTTPGYILCILVPFLLLIGYNGLNCVILFKRYKKEQTEEMDAEKAQLAEERRRLAEERLRVEEMMKELQELRLQLTQSIAEQKEQKSDGDKKKEENASK